MLTLEIAGGVFFGGLALLLTLWLIQTCAEEVHRRNRY